MAKITSWYGRLGNNVLQIGNALTIAYLNRSVFSCPSHDCLPAFSVPFGFSPASPGHFFSVDLNMYGDADKFKALRLHLPQEHLLPRLILPTINDRLKACLKNGALVTHARGGDIFAPNPHHSYIPHPLDFYLHLANSYEKIILVYEDQTNPVVNILSKNPQFELTTNNVLTDFAILINAKFIALGGFGSFVPSACLLNKNLAKVYYSNISPLSDYLPIDVKFNKTFINLVDYIGENKWLGNDMQKDFMLKYKLSTPQSLKK